MTAHGILIATSEAKHITFVEPTIPEKKPKKNELGILDITSLVKSVEDDHLKNYGGFGIIRRGMIDYDPTDEEKTATNIEVAIKTLKVSCYSAKDMWSRKVCTMTVQLRLYHCASVPLLFCRDFGKRQSYGILSSILTS